MRIVIDYNGSKAICRISRYLHPDNPHYDENTLLADCTEDIQLMVLNAAEKTFKDLLSSRPKDRRKGNTFHKKKE